MSTNQSPEELERNARDAKIEQHLLPTWEGYVSTVVGRPIDPLGRDAQLVHDIARATISHIVANNPYRTKADDKRLCPKVWHDIARIAGLPERRHPSVTTIETIVGRLRRRAEDAHRDPFKLVSA